MMRTPGAVALAMLLTVAGCKVVGDDYARPVVDVPGAFRGPAAAGDSLGEADWRSVFTDAQLQALVEQVLASNLDLQSAAARVREAQATLALVRSERLPQASLGLSTQVVPRNPGDALTSRFLAAGLLSWEIDLWGRIERRVEASTADLAGQRAAAAGARVSLVAETASRYFELGGAREVLDATERSAQLQRDALRLMQRRNKAGIVSAAEVRQAEGQLASTEARLPSIQRQVAALENVLALLQGRPPGPGPALPAVLQLPAALPAGLPSSMLERRPDLRQSEQRMVAANARVGEAKALFLPSLSITGAFGAISGQLDQLLRGGAQDVASLGPNVSQALYAGGALVANRDAAVARSEQAVLAYRSAVLNALREVSDALTSYELSGAEFEQQAKRATATREALRLADRRFAAGVISYLEVLDAQRQLLSAETELVNSKLNRQLALVQAYRALGGGWESR